MFPNPRPITFIGLCVFLVACGDSSITGVQSASMDDCSLVPAPHEYGGQSQDHDLRRETVNARLAQWENSYFSGLSACEGDSNGESGSSDDGATTDDTTDGSSDDSTAGTESSDDDSQDSETTHAGNEGERGDDSKGRNRSNGSDSADAGSGGPDKPVVRCPPPFTPTTVHSHAQDRNENGIVCEHDRGEAVIDDFGHDFSRR